jgi:hypothetical protein
MQDMRNDGFALKQNALGRVLNKNDPNQVSIGSTVIYYELKPTKIFCLFVAAAISIVKPFMAKYVLLVMKFTLL